MRIAIGSDHAGYDLKLEVAEILKEFHHEPLDVGCPSREPVDYPDYAEAVARALLDDRADRGIMICGSGVGASVAINKIPGIRAGLCHDTYSAEQGVEHDDMNVLVLGGRVIGPLLARVLVKAFLAANFSGVDRHRRRLNKIEALERRYAPGNEDPR